MARHLHTKYASKVIIEKPFGRDLESARQLNTTINNVFEEPKPSYRSLPSKEPYKTCWCSLQLDFRTDGNREYVDNVQITVAKNSASVHAEATTIRGALRDMIQNHTMQLVALTAMELPASLDPECIRDEKVKVLKAIQPWN